VTVTMTVAVVDLRVHEDVQVYSWILLKLLLNI